MPTMEYNRQLFERQIARLNQISEEQGGKLPYLSRILLKATLEGEQLTAGQGFFTLHQRAERADLIPLDPFTLAVNSLRWSDDTDAVFFQCPNGKNRLLVPSETDSNSYDQLQFRWSLQSRTDDRNGIVFDLKLPPCLSVELHLDIPDTMVLTASAGLVLPDEEHADAESGFRTWRVLLGHHSNATLTITADRTMPSERRKPTIRQVTTYIIAPHGLETRARVMFDRADPRPEELLLELEMPLRPVEIRYGDSPVAWTRSPISPDVTEIRVDLSPFVDEEPQELVVVSLGPLRENQRWVLPRVRVTSSDIFWSETRCGVTVTAPLRARNLTYHQAVQVAPRRTFDWTDEELYVFQLFQEDAQIELEVVYAVPHVAMNSAAQIYWSDNEIRSTVYLDCSVSEGERFTLNFPISEHWIIDSVTAFPQPQTTSAADDFIFLWDVQSDTQSQVLSVQLKHPLLSRQPVALQVSCRFAHSSQTQFRLPELSPFVFFHRRGESHHIATQLDLTNHQLKSSVDASTFNVPRTISIGGYSLSPTGDIYPLDSRTQNIHFELERMRPNYTADISCNMLIDDGDLIPTFRIRCEPLDSSLSRVFVHFTPSSEENELKHWDWSLVGDSRPTRPLRVQRFSQEELGRLLPIAEQHRSEHLQTGEIWEIRFDALQSGSFELLAESSIPLADSMVLPLASVPLASAQRGELTIESPQHFDYRIVNTRFDPIPIAPAAWDRYQSVRAAFRYEPQEEPLRSQHSPLMLQRLTPDERFDTAWVWSLRLDSQYASEGAVQNRALFLVENQGRETLRITLPYEINVADVLAIWLDSQQIPWQYDEVRRAIDVALPVGQRFVSIAMEYTYQDLPLVRQRKLRPRFPAADIPVLSGSWISWFPPEFDVSMRRAVFGSAMQPTSHFSLSKALDYLLTGTYRSFLGGVWDDVFYGGQRRLDAETASKYFFAELANVFQRNPVATWGDLIGDERILSDVRAQLANDSARRVVESNLLIDKQALAFLGITPATPIVTAGPIHAENVREKLFEDSGLILLVATRTRDDGIKQYFFGITTQTTLSLNRQFQAIPAGHCARAVPHEIFVLEPQSSPWTPAPRWLSETTLSSSPWSTSAQAIRRTAFTSDWHAYELPVSTEQTLYIVHRQTFAALQWIAFLAVLLITCRKPFSSPWVLLPLLIVFELIARSVAPCYIGIPSGAFIGVLVSIAFMMIRSQVVLSDPPLESFHLRDSTECSISFVPTPLLVRSVLLFGFLTFLAGLSVSASAQIIPEQFQNSSRKEPYRIFYPTDSQGQVIGQRILVPVEFLNLLHQNIKADDTETLPPWSITKAVYQGSLIRGASGYLECSDDFKAVYDIYLDTSSAAITLPNLPAVQGRFLWNGRPIQPIWSDDVQNDTLSFAIENETPGKHILEIALSPQSVLQNGNGTFQIAFAIPKVPDSTLRLHVPSDAPPVNVPDARGAVTANTAQSPILFAELGPAEQLSLAWTDDPNRSETLVSEVEQFFRIRVRPRQIELEALFRFRIDGGSVRYLTIQTDPRWIRSGQFRCEEHPIAQRPETALDTLSQIDFPSPVSDIVTLQADFVLRGDFYGAGNLRLPDFSAVQARVARSMLAVYADPTLELDLPIEGRSSGFEAGWQGTVALESFFRDVPFLDTLLARPTETSPDAEYDLHQTESDWTLNIRTKKVIPDVDVSQFVQFDTVESRIRVIGNFTAASDVFQQHFSAVRPIQIETLEVRDSNDDVIESRFQQVAPETAPEQYLIFFKRPVAGTYTIAVRGFFETDTREERPLQPVPLLTFDRVQTTAHALHLFRTSAVITEIPAEQSGWARSSALPTVPETLAQSISLGTWRRAESTETENTSDALQFSLSPNLPTVRCTTILSLHVDADDQWTMALDYTVNVTDGELRTLRFRWDERCGVIQSIEPSANWSLGQFGGQQTLTLFLNEPIREEQHVKIVVPVNVSGAASLPNVFPLVGEANQFESKLFADLPLRQGSEIIPWDLNRLIEVEEQAVDAERLSFRAIDTNFSATISRNEARLIGIFYDIGFLVKRDGTILGSVTVDLRNRGQDDFILHMPEGYEPIQISSAGLILGRTRLAESNRWRINIGTSDYPQRVNVLFRVALPQSLTQWNREQIVSTLQFPFLEEVAVQETLWTLTFEGNLPPLNVTTIRDRHWGTGMIASSDFFGSEESDLGEYLPISGIDAARSLIGVNLIREHNLLQVLKSVPASLRQEEMHRWFLHWQEEWDMVADKVDFQISHLPLTLHNVRPNLIVRPVDAASELDTIGIIRPFLEIMGARTQESLRLNKEETVQEKFGTTMDLTVRHPVPILTSQVYWQGRSSEEMQYLFGMEEGLLRGIRLASLPSTGSWILEQSEHVWLWGSLSLLIPIFVLLSVRQVYLAELWLQFPHFWGMTLGFLLWVFVPESFIGPIIIALTFGAFFRPSWPRYRYKTYP